MYILYTEDLDQPEPRYRRRRRPPIMLGTRYAMLQARGAGPGGARPTGDRLPEAETGECRDGCDAEVDAGLCKPLRQAAVPGLVGCAAEYGQRRPDRYQEWHYRRHCSTYHDHAAISIQVTQGRGLPVWLLTVSGLMV